VEYSIHKTVSVPDPLFFGGGALKPDCHWKFW